MELCKKCNTEHDLKKSCPGKKKSGKKLEKQIGVVDPGAAAEAQTGSTASTGKPSIATQIGWPGSPQIVKSERKRPMSYNDMKKSEKATPSKPKADEVISLAELKKREEEIMELEERVGSLASHIKDVLKKFN